MSDSHPHKSGRQEPLHSLRLVLIVSSLYMGLEVIGGLISGSLALYADAGHMFIDSFSVGLSLMALWLSKQPPNAKRTYGYHRAEILAALLNGSTLIIVSLWIFYEAWFRFQAPEPIQGEVLLGVASGGLIVNLFSLVVLKRHSHEGVNMRAVWLHVLMDTLGSISAMIAGVLVIKFNWIWADPVVSCVIAIFILQGAWRLVTECVDVLLESTPEGFEIEHVRRSICSVAGVADVHDLHVWTVKSGTYSLSVHVRMNDMTEQSKLLTEITKLIEDKFGIYHLTIQLEGKGFQHTSLEFHECSLARNDNNFSAHKR